MSGPNTIFGRIAVKRASPPNKMIVNTKFRITFEGSRADADFGPLETGTRQLRD